MRGCSGSSRSPAASRATSRPRRRARSTRAASSATRSSHAYGAAFDNPDLVVCCVVGDGEAETGPLAASWHSNKFLNPARDGAVLPILHLNGYKIANPTVLARIPQDELRALLEGYGHAPCFVEGDDPDDVHQALAAGRSTTRSTRSREIQHARARRRRAERPRWPMIVLRTPKGWTGPKEVDGKPVEGTLRSHQVPLAELAENPEHLRHARGVDALLPPGGAVRRARPAAREELARWRPTGERRMGANPHANGGLLLRDLRAARLPRLRGRRARAGARRSSEATRVLGGFLRDVMRRNETPRTSASSAPTRRRPTGSAPCSRRPTARGWPRSSPGDDHLAPDGRVMEVLTEHLCQGWLEGYLLTGRHGAVQLLRGVHPHRRLDVQPAREVAEGHARRSRGGGRSRR